MSSEGDLISAAVVASAAAGPLYLLALGGAAMIGSIPEPIPVSPVDLVALAWTLAAALVVGFLLSFVPNLLGTTVMTALARRFDEMGEPLWWGLAGAAAGAAIAWMSGAWAGQGTAGYALTATGAACAGICRARLGSEP